MSDTLIYATLAFDSHTDVVSTSTTYRCVISPEAQVTIVPGSYVQIKLGYDSAGSNPCEIGEVHFGRSAADTGGDLYEFAETPTQVYFNNGDPDVSLSADVWSDLFQYDLTHGYTYIVSVHLISDPNNEVHHKSADVDGFDSYAKAGNLASSMSFGTPDSTYADKAYVVENIIENDGSALDANLIDSLLTLSASTFPSSFSTLPDLQLAFTMAEIAWVDAPLTMPAMSISGAFGERWNLEERLPYLEFEAHFAARPDAEFLLPALECAAEMLAGANASLDERLAVPTVAILTGLRAAHEVPILSLEIELTGEITGALDRDIPFLSLDAEGGREGAGAVDAVLFVPKLTATAGTKQANLSADFFVLELTATGGAAASLDTRLPEFVVTATGYGMDKGLEQTLFMLDIAASGTHRFNTVDRDLFTLRLAATASGMQATLQAYLSWMRMDATLVSGAGATLDAYVSVPTLTGLMSETPLMTLDAEFGAIYMGSEAGAGDDPVLPGGHLVDTTRWTETVLRHSRW